MSTFLSQESVSIATQTPRELLPVFYEQYGLGSDGSDSCPFVRIEITKKFVLFIPNFKARKKAVLKHDIHHLVTGYPSTFKGETEISAWEIGSGCKLYWAAWVLDLHGMMMGIPFNLKGVFNAFRRGRQTTNLYHDHWTDEQALDQTISTLQKNLRLDQPVSQKGLLSDLIVFFFALAGGLIYSLLSIIFIPFVLLYSIYIRLKHKGKSALHEMIIKS
jgi:hypothetical protein